MQTVVETPRYLVDAERIFTADERDAIVDLVARNPRCGVLIPAGGGIRKVRVGKGDRGKRGGARVIYLFGGEGLPVFLLAAVSKSEKADISPAERVTMGRAVAGMLAHYRRRR